MPLMSKTQLQVASKMPPQLVAFIPKACGGNTPHKMAIEPPLYLHSRIGQKKNQSYVNFLLEKQDFPRNPCNRLSIRFHWPELSVGLHQILQIKL